MVSLNENPTPTESEATHQTKQKILSAAKDEFAQFGFEGARMQRLANRADIPKPNIHYHFKTKQQLYLAVLEQIIASWNQAFNHATPESDPAEALELFVREKLNQARFDPAASRLFANEMIQGAPNLKRYLSTDMRPWVLDRAHVILAWVAAKKIRPIDPERLIFLVWSVTQHYADFQVQALALLNRAEFDESVAQETSDFLVDFVLRGCGLQPKANAS